jgi:hypothetical protein
VEYVCTSVFTDYGAGRGTVDLGSLATEPFTIRNYYTYGEPSRELRYEISGSYPTTVSFRAKKMVESLLPNKYLNKGLHFGGSSITENTFRYRSKMISNDNYLYTYLHKINFIAGETYNISIGDSYYTGTAKASGDTVYVGSEDADIYMGTQQHVDETYVSYRGSSTEGYYNIVI